MRQLVASVLVMGCSLSSVAAFQAGAGGSGGGGIKACSLLPKELAAKYFSGNKCPGEGNPAEGDVKPRRPPYR